MYSTITKTEKKWQEVQVQYHVFECVNCHKKWEFDKKPRLPSINDKIGREWACCSPKCLVTEMESNVDNIKINISQWNFKKVTKYLKTGENILFGLE